MEDNSLESLPSPSTTSTTPTTTTATTTTTTSTNTTRSSIAEHAATTNTAATDHGSECQQQPDQLAAAPANKRHHDPPYDWQLLSQEELDRIAYNSRRQTKARQRANPPKCAHCPEARFTSMAMLSTHYLSRRHLARVRKQEQIHSQGQNQAQSADTSSLQGTSVSIADNSPSHDATMEDAVAASESNPTTQEHPTRTLNTAIQRKRKQERDRKKARAHLEKQLKLGHGVVSQRAQGQEEMEEDDEAATSTSKEILGDKHHDGYMDDEKVSTAPSDPAAQLTQRDPSSPLEPGGDMAASIAVATPSMSNTTLLQQQLQQPQQQGWYCSICGSSWRQERAWKGHLLSAQHLRHTLATMQQIAPDIQPYGRVDVMASMDPFGWGTGAGVVEEEEEESEDEDGDDGGSNNNVEGKAEDDDGDDMEMSD